MTVIKKQLDEKTKNILELVRQDPRFAQTRSVDWFKQKIQQLGGNSPTAKTDLLATTRDRQSMMVLPGTMVAFSYDPKYKEELPYYDKFPMSLIFGMTDEGFMGINFHYLSYKVRKILFDKIWMIAQRYHNNKQQVTRLTWKLLGNVSKFPEVRPAVKQYLYSHVRSRFIRIDVEDWATAIHLPVETFAKKSQGYIASQSGLAIRKIVRR